MSLTLVKPPVKELKPLELDLLAELEAAHLIIANAVGLMSIHQTTKLAMINREMNLIDSGVTRYTERHEVVARAHAQVTSNEVPL
jgi:hypothetical protein